MRPWGGPAAPPARAQRAASSSSAPPRIPTACPKVLAASLWATALAGGVYVQAEACSVHHGCPGWTLWGQEDWGRRPPPNPRRAQLNHFTVKPPASDFLLRLWFFGHIALIFSSKGKGSRRCSARCTETSILNRGRISFPGKPMVDRGVGKIINSLEK